MVLHHLVLRGLRLRQIHLNFDRQYKGLLFLQQCSAACIQPFLEYYSYIGWLVTRKTMQFTIPNQVHIGSFGLEERQKCLYAAERLRCAHKKRGLRGNCGLGMAKSAQKSCSACQKWLLTTKNARKQGERVRLEGKRRKRSAGLAKRFLDFARNDKQSARNDKQSARNDNKSWKDSYSFIALIRWA